VLAGKVNEPAEQEYFDEVIRPRLGPDVTYVGELDATEKRDVYGKTACLLFPVRAPEPFGMVMVEAMACGTPVVALREGSVPEVVADGRSGIICDSPDELPGGIDKAMQLRAGDCRDHVARHFDRRRMAHGYENVYRQLSDHQPLEASHTPTDA
jgi:glycosyltransferase involved in cell wall biosynthesis